jgi:hypothetical protein
MVDDAGMETTLRIYRHTCQKCDRPALTFDENERCMPVDEASV